MGTEGGRACYRCHMCHVLCPDPTFELERLVCGVAGYIRTLGYVYVSLVDKTGAEQQDRSHLISPISSQVLQHARLPDFTR